MGIAGTEVAKQAADMLLTDDDFASIIAAVEEGRNIFTNMQAFISFLLSCNLGEIAAVLFAALLRIPTPLSPLHLLWVNLVTDGPPATALGFNPPDPYVMKRLPRPRHDSLLTPLLLVRYCITGGYVGLASLAAYLYGFSRKGISFDKLRQSMDSRDAGLVHSQSMALSVLVVVEMLKALSAVSLSQSLFRVPPWTNPYLLASVILPLSLHGLLIHIPFLAKLFGVSALSIRDWIVSSYFIF
jgi:Ca2+-transporting ATPase